MRPAVRIPSYNKWSHHRSGWRYCMEGLLPLHISDGVLLVDYFEEYVKNKSPIREPWIGFLHNVPTHPSFIDQLYGSEWNIDLNTVLESPTWAESQSFCLGLLVLSEYTRAYLTPRVEVPVHALLHATETKVPAFSFDRFLNQPNRKLILVGHWLRDFQSIYDLEAPGFSKFLLGCGEGVDYTRVAKLIRHNPSVEFLPYCPAEDYDQLLQESVVFLPLIDTSANNALIECIARNTPVLIKRLPAAEEYLGASYPLFYDRLEDATQALADPKRIRKALQYLRRLNKKQFTQTRFVKSFARSPAYRAANRQRRFSKLLGPSRAFQVTKWLGRHGL